MFIRVHLHLALNLSCKINIQLQYHTATKQLPMMVLFVANIWFHCGASQNAVAIVCPNGYEYPMPVPVMPPGRLKPSLHRVV